MKLLLILLGTTLVLRGMEYDPNNNISAVVFIAVPHECDCIEHQDRSVTSPLLKNNDARSASSSFKKTCSACLTIWHRLKACAGKGHEDEQV